ncbi:MAG: endonuclease [Nanoarchaeota archaeon]|nr:endonuclease [Nanoarchaeota archaeon]
MNRLQKIYSVLHKTYGPQGWWPLTPLGSTRTRHHSGRPRKDAHRFEIMLGAILTQNTAWTNVEKALEQLHKNKLVRHDRILKTKKEKIAGLIRSAGYYNQKAERLAIISKFIKDNTLRSLMAMDAVGLRRLLLEVKGIGPETADSIVLYAFEKPSFVIDAYTKRIFSRVGLCAADADYHEMQIMFEQDVRKDVDVYKEYHALIVEHAKRHCRTKPKCEGCPISKLCKRNI